MELSNLFVVPVDIEEAWRLLTDIERIAPCMPGAELHEIDGEQYHGAVKVKVGPITAHYKGKAAFVEKDETTHQAVLRAEGRDTRGQGNANATITATLTPEGAGTKVTVVTDLAITGRAAQFGRGVMTEVSSKLLSQFVSNLETDVLRAGSPDSENGHVTSSGSPKMAPRQPEAVDLFATAGAPILKRMLPAVVGIVAAIVVGRRLCRRATPGQIISK